VSPNAGPVAGGTSVTITGTNFTGATAVKFGSNNAAAFAVTSASSISAVSPAGIGTVDVTVTTPGGTSSTSPTDQFSYVPAPTVTGVSPHTGPVGGGTAVTIAGTNLTGATAVKFGSTAATSFTVKSTTSIVAVLPAETAGQVDVTVTTIGGTSAISSADVYKFLPTITSVIPNGGPKAGGTSVTVTGTGFALGTTATIFAFGSTKGTSVSCSSTTTCSVISPAHEVGTVDVKATVNKQTSSKSTGDQFTYS
jgi:IPT/TIG domain